MVSSERGIFSESTARGGRESGFATDEQHRNREKDPFLTPRNATESSFILTKSEDAICKAGCTGSAITIRRGSSGRSKDLLVSGLSYLDASALLTAASP